MADRLNGLLVARQLGNCLLPWDSRMNVSENREAPRRKEAEVGQPYKTTALLTIFTNSHTHKSLQTPAQSSDSDCQSEANSVETRARTARSRRLRSSDQRNLCQESMATDCFIEVWLITFMGGLQITNSDLLARGLLTTDSD
jgi:hypothetical protein